MSTLNTTLTIRVIDNGIGVPADFNIDADPGLGLTIIRTLTTADLGGTFLLENDPHGQGALATLTVEI